MRFTQDDIQRFADWSHDSNPLHVDPAFAKETFFGRPIAHGVLSLLRAFADSDLRPTAPLASLDVEFRGAVVPGVDYDTASSVESGGFVVGVTGPDGAVLTARGVYAGDRDSLGATSPVPGPAARERQVPAVHGTADFERGVEAAAVYRTAVPDLDDPHRGRLRAAEAQVLALCSYVVGMEIPGLRSLFTRLTVQFGAPAEAPEIWFRARTTKFDRHFRLLETHVDAVTPDGQTIATCNLRGYVPLGETVGDVEELAAHLPGDISSGNGRVALVTGGSRGLGADIAAALSLAGWRVFVASRGTSTTATKLAEALGARGRHISFVHGDVGDATWCRDALERIRATEGHLDLLVLNASTPPSALRLTAEASDAQARYIADSLRLTSTPLTLALPMIGAAGGTVVFVSSSFVADPPPGFGHYVAAKQAGESMVQAAQREWPGISTLVVRPPRLQTSWNDTPTGVAGAIPPAWVALRLIEQLQASATRAGTDVVSDFPPIARVTGATGRGAQRDFPIRAAATFTSDPLLPGLRFWLTQLGMAPDVEVAPYAQVLQSLLDPTSLFAAKGGLNVVFVRVRDWLRELPADQADSIEFLREFLPKSAQELVAALRTHRGRAGAETLLVLCPSYGAKSSAESILLRQTENEITAGLGGVPGLSVVTAESFHGRYLVDEDDIRDELREKIAHIPYRDQYCHFLATVVARHVHRRVAPIRKVVVVDCDNTLWAGVVGEVGADGVEFNPSHLALHDTLTRLTQAGVLVCLCSKNEEPDVWRVFESRTEMRLRREDVVAAAINWTAKSENLRDLAARLTLGLDSFIFIDDNPVECAEVRSRCPEVLTLQWPTDDARARRLLDHAWELDAVQGTKEDAKRAQMYRDEFRRQEARQGTQTFADFIRTLGLQVDVSPLAPEDVRRASQLTLRTNQFNFTTIRRDETEMEALSADGRHEVRTIRVRDRFGDYGLVGLLVAERQEERLAADTFLLSCRVLGRGVEHHIAAELGRMARAQGLSTVRMRVEPTTRNTPARSFLEALASAGQRTDASPALECDFDAAALAALEFSPAEDTGVVDEEIDSAPTSTSASPSAGDSPRRREQQINQTAFEWSVLDNLQAAIEGRTKKAALATGTGDVADDVYATFSKVLQIPADRIKAIDGLEALGCDSLKIVEITVALLEKYPWLPSTLLFEHRSVHEVLKEIDSLASEQADPVGTSPTIGMPRPTAPAGDIAVVGMHLRCAGADSPEELWQLLSRGQSAVRPVDPRRRYFVRPLDDTRPHWAGLLSNPGRFDAELFGISPREAEFVDPQLRIFLEVAWAALADAGASGASHDPTTGVFVGVMYGDYGAPANQGAKERANPYRCWEGFSLANRLSHLLDFHGPSLAVDTACSSSGTALHLATRALQAGDCRVAVVGGVNLILDPDRFGAFSRLGILSSRGLCEPFGADADGTVLGEGAGAVILRPMADAIARGDRIYGVIKGTGLSTGSGTVGFTAPNPQAQADAIRRSIQAAGIDPRTVSYVETHGTGTNLGDPIEVRGLTLAYGTPELQDAALQVTPRHRIGSIKPNIGHLEAGAGIIGFIKVLLQMRHRTLLPSLTSARPNPHIPFGDTPFEVQRKLEPWPAPLARLNGAPIELPRRAGLSSFGVGGANAHVVLEEAPSPSANGTPLPMERPGHILTLSAPNRDALVRQAEHVGRRLALEAPESFANWCFSLNVGRALMQDRLAIVAPTQQRALEQLTAFAKGQAPKGCAVGRATGDGQTTVAFLFTGQGSQYAGMGQGLYEHSPVFRASLDRCAAIFDPLLGRPLLPLLFAPANSQDADLLNQTGFTQPALFAFQYALAELWRSWGVTPDVVMGHSVGEIAALCVAGGLSVEDGLTLIAARGRLMQALPSGGAMVSVMAAEARVRQALAGAADQVAIAAVNAPGQTVISGEGSRVAAIASELEGQGIRTKALAVSHAFHSPLMRPMLAEYESVVRSLRFERPHIPFVSCVDAAFVTEEVTRPEYWLRQVTDAVRFADGVAVAESRGVHAYVEIGPHPVLLALGRESAGDRASQTSWLPSLRRDEDAWETMLDSVARLHTIGVPVDWARFDEPYARKRVSTPAYAFAEQTFWVQPVTAASPAPMAIVPAVDEGIDRLLYDVRWRQADRVHNDDTTPAHWVVLVDANDALSPSIAPLSSTVTRVQCGSRFERLGDHHYTLNPFDPEGFSRLLSEVSTEVNGIPLIVVSAWALDAPGNTGLTLGTLADAHRRLLAGALHLTRAVAGLKASAALWFVTRRAVATHVEDSKEISLTQAPLWGFARTAALEHPDVWGGIVDIGDEAPDELRATTREIVSRGADDQVALRGALRLVPRLVRREARASSRVSLAPSGTYLVLGGTGALGISAARWLAAAGARRLVLASRSGQLDAKAERACQAMRDGGITLTVARADADDADALGGLLADIAGSGHPLRGVVHAAGTDGQAPIADMTLADLDRLLEGKVSGGWLLHELTKHLELDLFLVFSSISALLGAQGRAHYAAVNGFLDTLAEERARLELPGSSVCWGPWRGGGMATAETLAQFERIGNHGLEPARALAALDDVVNRQSGSVAIADIDWSVFSGVYEARRERPFVSEVTSRATAAPTAGSADAASSWLALVQSTPPAERLERLSGLLRAEMADTLGYQSAEDMALDRSFFDAGMDSLMMADFMGRLKRRTEIAAPLPVFELPSVAALAPRLLELLLAGAGETATVSTNAEAPSSRHTFPSVEPEPVALVRYAPAHRDALVAFVRRSFPDRDPELIAARFTWMFLASAARVGAQPSVWLVQDAGNVVGHTGAIPVRIAVKGEVHPTAWFVDTMVSPEYRQLALGPRLMMHAQDDVPFALSLGQTNEMRQILFRLGWQQVAPLNTAQLLIRPEQVLKGKVPAPVAWAAGLSLRASSAVRDLVAARSAVETRQVVRFGQAHDALWHNTVRDLECAVVRDASYLNWKYVDRPGQSFVRVEIVEGGDVRGVVVLMTREPDAVYRYRRAFLVDIVASPSDERLVARAIQAACVVSAELGADSLSCHFIGDWLGQALKRAGFIARAPERYLLVRPGGLTAAIRPHALMASSWFVTQGDSDIDRP
jgi:FkbH-like protein